MRKITQERIDQIKNLYDYNEQRLRSISFNNCKIDCLKIECELSQEVAQDAINQHHEKYNDEAEVDLLFAFYNKYKIK